jgi:hypothetical protein
MRNGSGMLFRSEGMREVRVMNAGLRRGGGRR